MREKLRMYYDHLSRSMVVMHLFRIYYIFSIIQIVVHHGINHLYSHSSFRAFTTKLNERSLGD